MRRRWALPAIAALAGVLAMCELSAHAGLRTSNPREGVKLGDTPTQVELSFYERPELTLSSVQVLDGSGAAVHAGSVHAVPGDPLSLAIPVRPLTLGVYVVHWRIVSAVDGHVTSGAYAFGVRVSPGAAPAAPNTYSAAPRIEIAARAVLILGLMLLAGAAGASIGAFGGARPHRLALAGAIIALIGTASLTAVQMRTTGGTLRLLMSTSIGHSLAWRAAAITAAAAAAAFKRPALAALAALAAIAVHATAGHAAAVPRITAYAIGLQWLHFAAAALWVGGLAAMIAGVHGEASSRTARAVGRFSALAGLLVAIVVVTGIARSWQELSGWSQLATTPYGRALLVKIVLLAAIVAAGALHRRYSVPVAGTTLRPLRRLAAAEGVLLAAVVAAAATLGTLPPPSNTALIEVGTIDVRGADFATTIRTRLTAPSDQPGPNRFTLRVEDYDSAQPVRDARVSLRFTPADDPGVAPTSLPLQPEAAGLYSESGSNLSFDGRWMVEALVQRGTQSTTVPLAVAVAGAPAVVSVNRRPGQPVIYMAAIKGQGSIWISPDPERPGPATLRISIVDVLSDYRPIDAIVVTATTRNLATRQIPVRRLERGRFESDIDLQKGINTIAVVARAPDGTRLRSVLDVPIR